MTPARSIHAQSKNSPPRRPGSQQFPISLRVVHHEVLYDVTELIYDIQISGKVMRCTASQVRLVIIRWRLSRLSAQQESLELCLDALSKKAATMRGQDSFDDQARFRSEARCVVLDTIRLTQSLLVQGAVGCVNGLLDLVFHLSRLVCGRCEESGRKEEQVQEY